MPRQDCFDFSLVGFCDYGASRAVYLLAVAKPTAWLCNLPHIEHSALRSPVLSSMFLRSVFVRLFGFPYGAFGILAFSTRHSSILAFSTATLPDAAEFCNPCRVDFF